MDERSRHAERAGTKFELQYRSLIVGLVPAGNDGGLHPFAPDALHDAYREITGHYPYAEFRLVAGGGAAQLSNGPRDFVTLDPRLLQVRTDIVLTPAMAQAKTIEILRRAIARLNQDDFAQCGIHINAHTPVPSSSPNARSYLTDELMDAGEQARMLGPGFFACLQFRRSTTNIEEQLSVEPLLADDRFLFLNLDVQRAGPHGDLDELDDWLNNAFDLLRDRATRLLEVRMNHRRA
jgi:hypothetical protein